MFSLVTKEVRLTTKNSQRPYKYASLESIVCLTGNCQGAPTADGVIDAVHDAKRSESEELHIALQTKNSDALESYLQKYPDSPKRIEVLEAISSLRRSEFDEWTLYAVADNRFPQFIKINSIEQLGGRVAVLQKYVPNPSLPIVVGKQFPDAATVEDLVVLDCDQPFMVKAETKIVNKAGELLYHYYWGDPRYLSMSIGIAVAPTSVAGLLRAIVCHDELRTPLVGKRQLASMRFPSLASTTDGKGDIFYTQGQSRVDAEDEKEFITIIRYHEEIELTADNGQSIADAPKYLTQVSRVRVKCTDNELAITKLENYDAASKLVNVNTPSALGGLKWIRAIESSPFGQLQRIACPGAFGGLGIELTAEGSFIKVVRVIDGAPAQKAGVKINDIITHLDNESVEGLGFVGALAKIRGRVDTVIQLRINREGQDTPMELSVKRADIQAPSIQSPSVQAPSVPWPSVQPPSVQWPSVQGQVKQ